MASEKKITMREYNGTDYDTLYPKTIVEQVDGVYSKDEVLTDATKTLYNLKLTATPNEVFQKLAMPYGYYGFDVTVIFSDGLPVPNVLLNGLQDFAGNTATTNANGRCPIAVAQNKTQTVSISNYIGVTDAEITITAKDGVVFTPVTITLERDTSVHLIQTSQSLRVLTGVPVDMCIVGGGASGYFPTGFDTAGNGGGGGYAKNILSVILQSPDVLLTVGAGGKQAIPYAQYFAGGDTTIIFNGITESASGATNNVGNGSGVSGSDGTDGTVHVFDDNSLDIPGGGGGSGLLSTSTQRNGGHSFGGKGGSVSGSTVAFGATSGNGPGGGGGGGAYGSPNYYSRGGDGADGGLYIRVNAPEVSI